MQLFQWFEDDGTTTWEFCSIYVERKGGAKGKRYPMTHNGKESLLNHFRNSKAYRKRKRKREEI